MLSACCLLDLGRPLKTHPRPERKVPPFIREVIRLPGGTPRAGACGSPLCQATKPATLFFGPSATVEWQPWRGCGPLPLWAELRGRSSEMWPLLFPEPELLLLLLVGLF